MSHFVSKSKWAQSYKINLHKHSKFYKAAFMGGVARFIFLFRKSPTQTLTLFTMTNMGGGIGKCIANLATLLTGRSVVSERKMVDLATATCSKLRPKHFEKYLLSQPGSRYRLPGDNHR